MAPGRLEVVPPPTVVRSDALGLPTPRSPEVRPLASLRLYQPRWVWPPNFEHTHEWRVLREDIAAHGIRTPLRILKNGWVIDGTHRYLIAKELGLDPVPVQLVPLVLSHRDGDPLSPVDRLRIERTAVLEALGRRHLTPHQRDVMFLRLEEAQESLFGSAAARTERRLGNLRWRRSLDDEPPTFPTLDEFARTYQIPVRRLKKLLTLARSGEHAVREEFKAGAISLERAYAATVGARQETADLDPVVRFVSGRIAVLTRMMDCWAACPLEHQGRLLDELARWLDAFRQWAEDDA